MTSQHFTEKELSCHHCGQNHCRPELLYALETFRAAVGRPVIVDDAYRCVLHNADVGGAPNSEHLLGLAADIKVEGMTAVQLEVVATRIPIIRGIGRNDHLGYLHIDTREHPARWCYSQDGVYVPWYHPKNSA